MRRSATASTFAASLELVKEGIWKFAKDGCLPRSIAQRRIAGRGRPRPTNRRKKACLTRHLWTEQERMIEAILFAPQIPLTLREITSPLPHRRDPAEALVHLRKRYFAGRGAAALPDRDAYARTARILGYLMHMRQSRPGQTVRAATRTLGDHCLSPAHHPWRGSKSPRSVRYRPRGLWTSLLELALDPLGRRKMTARPGR